MAESTVTSRSHDSNNNDRQRTSFYLHPDIMLGYSENHDTE